MADIPTTEMRTNIRSVPVVGGAFAGRIVQVPRDQWDLQMVRQSFKKLMYTEFRSTVGVEDIKAEVEFYRLRITRRSWSFGSVEAVGFVHDSIEDRAADRQLLAMMIASLITTEQPNGS